MCRKQELGAKYRIEARNEIQKIRIDAARLDLIDRCRKRELGARFRFEVQIRDQKQEPTWGDFQATWPQLDPNLASSSRLRHLSIRSSLAASILMFSSSFLVSILNLAPSSRLRHLSIRSSFVDVSGLVTGLVFEPGSELPFAMPVDQIEPGNIQFKSCKVSHFDTRI